MSDVSTGDGGDSAATAGATDQASQTTADDRPLGAAGEKALDEWKLRARAAESSLKDAQKAGTERDALRTKLAEYEEATKTEQEKALDKARQEAQAQGKSEADQAWAARVIKTDVKAAARERLADPSDAIAFLDLSQFSVNDNGDTDEKSINAAIDALLKDKPHLAKQSEQLSSTGSADQGARGTGTKSLDMNSLIRQAASRR